MALPSKIAIYCITSPSGKMYIGLSQNIEARWRTHIARARKGSSHPFYRAIRKYGQDGFSICILSEHNSREEAAAAEQEAIHIFSTNDRNIGYNISPGGEMDGPSGGKRLAELLKEDKTFRANWLKKHNDSMRNNGRAKESQRKRWATMDADTYKAECESRRKGVTKMWANRDINSKREVSKKISESLTKQYSTNVEMKSRNESQLINARKNIDHALRKRRQKEALIAYWTPERKKEVSEKRRAMAAAKRNVVKQNDAN
jgi:group I intron endonuclease